MSDFNNYTYISTSASTGGYQPGFVASGVGVSTTTSGGTDTSGSTTGNSDTSGGTSGTSTTSVTTRAGQISLDVLYNTIFPIGGVDDNNKYAELTGDKINTVQLVEPTLAVSEFVITEKQLVHDKNNIPYKYAYRIPLISIEDHLIPQVDICSFKLDYTGFIPNVMFEFMDTANTLLSTNIPKDGSIIRIYIGGQGDELYYKPIRQDFVLTSIRKVGNSQLKYRVYGKLNVPYGYRKEPWCGGKYSAMQSLFNIAIWTGLGFSTNFTKSNALDVMNWTNCETGTYFDFIEDITAHACYSPNTFFTSFIDQYNVLNFVECHSLLSHGGSKTDTPAMIYKCYPPQELPQFDPNTQEKTTENQLPLKEGDDALDNQHQKLSYYFLTNDEFFDGWTNYIESFQEITNGSSALSDGFKTHVTYSDSNTGSWGFSQCDFLIRPIDNLKRDPATQRIRSIDEAPSKDSYIPLNLIQMTKDEYVDSQSGGVDNMTSVESFNNFGNIDTSNMFKQYYFAEVQNAYQLKCMKKCGLKVKLQNYNPSITKFSRIWVDIYDTHPLSNGEITTSNIEANDPEDIKNYREKKNENILKFDDEGIIEAINPRLYKKWPPVIFNRSLSGWYVVTEIEIDYDPNDNNLKMNLVLNRIEYKPCFKDEYERARKAIDKYKEENVPEDILVSQ